MLLLTVGCSGTNPGVGSSQPDPPANPAAPETATTTSTPATTTMPPAPTTPVLPTPVAIVTTTTVAAEPEIHETGGPEIQVDQLNTDELDALLVDLTEILSDLESSLAQEEGELFNE